MAGKKSTKPKSPTAKTGTARAAAAPAAPGKAASEKSLTQMIVITPNVDAGLDPKTKKARLFVKGQVVPVEHHALFIDGLQRGVHYEMQRVTVVMDADGNPIGASAPAVVDEELESMLGDLDAGDEGESEEADGDDLPLENESEIDPGAADEGTK